MLRAVAFYLLTLAAAVQLSAVEPVWTAKPGPWGQLEVRAVYLEPPDSLLAVIAKPNSVTHWSFDQMTEQGVRTLLERAGVPANVIEHLLSPGRVIVSGNSVSLYPQVEDLTALTAEVRSALYLELAKYPEGYRHLAYLQAGAGERISPHLPTPNSAALAKLYADGRAWLDGKA